MTKIWAHQALIPDGWQDRVSVSFDDMGIVTNVEVGVEPDGTQVGVLLPSPGNVHSHSFQRAMAGMAERRGDDPNDNFWTWRKIMYRFLDNLTPDDVAAIASFQQMEMLEAGYASSAEFHYLHHQSDGTPYDNIAELSDAIIAGATETGIGLTLLPVLYQYGGCDKRPLGNGQIRFGNDTDRFATLYEAAGRSLKNLPQDAELGVAPHSLRAVGQESLAACVELAGDSVKHIHIAEQVGEVSEVLEAWGARPVEWLFDNHDVDDRWCLVHATQMEPHETIGVAKSGATIGLCPITESNLGDGIFDGVRYQDAQGVFGIGSDSNVRISLSEELRTLEYCQRLQTKRRAVYASPEMSSGRALFEGCLVGGAQATGRKAGQIKKEYLADFMALDMKSTNLLGKSGDSILDSYIFTGSDAMISDVWAAGRHVVSGGQHTQHDQIVSRYEATILSLKDRI